MHSENCVVFLLSAWVNKHGRKCSGEELEQLARNIRVGHLTNSYIIKVLPYLDWFTGSKCFEEDFSVALTCVIEALPLISAPAAWRESRRRRTESSTKATLKISLGPITVTKLSEGKEVFSKSVYLNGFFMKLMCASNEEEDNETDEEDEEDEGITIGAGVFTDAARMKKFLPACLPNFAVAADATFVGGVRRKSCEGAFSNNLSDLSTNDIFGLSASTIVAVVAPFLDGNGVVKVSAKVDNLR